jgi:transposase InsO family protein
MLLEPSVFYYRTQRRDRSRLAMRIKESAMSRIRFGYQRITVLLRREGWKVGKKLVYRLYREQGLQVKTKQRKKLASQSRGTLELAKASNEPGLRQLGSSAQNQNDYIRPGKPVENGYMESFRGCSRPG